MRKFVVEFIPQGIHSKSEKVSGTAFSVKKIAKTFWVILGPFRVFLGHFGPFWIIFGPFCGIFGQICGKFNFFCGIVGVEILAFRMYASIIIVKMTRNLEDHHCQDELVESRAGR